MNYAVLRSNMVEQLREKGIRDKRVLEAMGQVQREEFVPEELKDRAYEDGPLPIGEGQTISQPFIVARMCELLKLSGSEKVLDIGTGSGYQAAVLSLLVKKVITIERHTILAEEAKIRLKIFGYTNVIVIWGDGKAGYAKEAPYEAIKCAAASHSVPTAWIEQLSEEGKLVMPIKRSGGQRLLVGIKKGEKLVKQYLDWVQFVPLV